MKEKKGFTLIELIAVIVIIGIIAILIVPSVSNYIVNTKNSTYKSHEKAMSEAAESYTIECINNNGKDCEIPGPNEEKEIYLDELIEDDFIDKLGDPAKTESFCNPNTSYVKIYNTGNNNYTYISCLYCSSYATENVKCVTYTGDGSSPTCVTLETHSEWTKDSRQVKVGCNDTGSGCLREEFKKTFSDTTNRGIITITDRSGNSTDCEVDVKVDKTAPTCEIVANGTATNGWYPLGTTFKLTNYTDGESGILTYGTGTSINPDFNKKLEQAPPRGITRIFGYVQDAAGNIGSCSVNAKIKTQFTIHYNKNNGTGSMPDKVCMVDDDCFLDPNTFTRTGYTFNGWNTREDGTGTAYADKANVKNIVFSGEVTLFAQWKVITYTITYANSCGTISPANPTTYTIETNAFTLNNPSKTGYTFNGWTGTGLSSPTKTVTIAKGSIGNRAYTANCGANTYTIGYTLNGGTYGTNHPTSGTYDSVLTINNPTKKFTVTINANNQGATIGSTTASSNQTFAGWTYANGTTSTAKYGTTSSAVTTSWSTNTTKVKAEYFKNLRDSSGTVTLTANWTAVNVTLPTISRTGYTCGYATTASGTKTYNSGAAYTPSTTTNSVTLYAVCTINSYTCAAGKYLAKGATACATCTANHYCAGGTYQYNPNTDQGINSCPSGYTNTTGQSAKNSCKISCAANKRVNAADAACNTACATGYEHAAHTVAAGSTSSACSAKKVVVTFNCNGGSGGGSQTFTYGVSGQSFSTSCTRTGYTLSGWNKKADKSGDHYSATSGVANNWINSNSPSVTLYAEWTIRSITCSAGQYLPKNTLTCATCTANHWCPGGTYQYNPNTDQGINSCPSGYTNAAGKSAKNTCTISCAANKRVNTADAACNTACATGYEHAAHTVAAGSTSSACSAKKVVVTFNCNGGSGGGSQTFTYGVSGQSFSTSCTKTGYTLSGWNKKADKSGDHYSATSGVANSWINSNSPSVTLYAEWTIRSITCSAGQYLPKNAVTCATCTANHWCPGGTYTFNTSTDQGINACPSGYTNGTGNNAKGSCAISCAANYRVNSADAACNTACATGYEHAAHTVQSGTTSSVCSAKNVTVTFNCNGGTGGGSQTFTYGVANQSFSTTCSATGYLPTGWKDSAGNFYSYDSPVVDYWINAHSPAVTLYAQWAPKSVNVTFDCNGGTGGGSQTFTYGVANQSFSTTCSATGYLPTGWKDSAGNFYSYDSPVVDAWIEGNSPSTTLYAQWTPKTVAVTFNCNGGTGGGTQTFTYGVPNQSFSTTCSRTNYDLTEWNKKSSGTGASYHVSSSVADNWINTYSPEITLYAQWEQAYTVKTKSGTVCSPDNTKNVYFSTNKFVAGSIKATTNGKSINCSYQSKKTRIKCTITMKDTQKKEATSHEMCKCALKEVCNSLDASYLGEECGAMYYNKQCWLGDADSPIWDPTNASAQSAHSSWCGSFDSPKTPGYSNHCPTTASNGHHYCASSSNNCVTGPQYIRSKSVSACLCMSPKGTLYTWSASYYVSWNQS